MKTLIPAILIGTLAGCAAPSKAPSPIEGPPRLSHGSLELSYVLGHDSHRFVFEARNDQVKATEYLEQEQLKSTAVDPMRYQTLLKKAQAQLQARAPSSETASSCRSPYVLTLKTEERTETLRGCRQGREGEEISRLARDAKYLMYSQK